MDKKIFRSKELLFIIPVLAAAVILWAVFSLAPKGNKVIVEKNGTAIESYSIPNNDEKQEIEITGENEIEVKIEITKDGARFVSSDCPDKVCVRTGIISASGESAVCLPARIAIRIEGNGEMDGVTY